MSKAKLLIVDDEQSIRDFLVRVLEREDYEVQTACNGAEALELLNQERFDLLLSDIKMDNVDGVELLGRAREKYADLAIILLTGHATVQSAVAALRRGAHEYLLKPVKNEDIVLAVAQGLKARTRKQRRNRLEQLAGQMMTVFDGDLSAEQPHEAASAPVDLGNLHLDPRAYKARLGDKSLDLTPTEFRLLEHLSHEPGTTFDYVTLVQAACGYSCTRQEAREIIGTHVLNLRQKLEIPASSPLYVESIRSIGYRLIPVEET